MYKTDKHVLPKQFDQSIGVQNNIGFDKNEKRITFPIRDPFGKLVAISGRAIKSWQIPRYKTYRFSSIPGYTPQNRSHLYLIDQVYPKHFFNPLYKGPTIVVEGYKAALWLTQLGYDAVAVQGSQITSAQLKWLSRIGGEKIIFLDNEVGKHMQNEKGESEALKMYRKLLRNKNLSFIATYPDGCEDYAPDDLNQEQIQWALQHKAQLLIPKIWKRK